MVGLECFDEVKIIPPRLGFDLSGLDLVDREIDVGRDERVKCRIATGGLLRGGDQVVPFCERFILRLGQSSIGPVAGRRAVFDVPGFAVPQ